MSVNLLQSEELLLAAEELAAIEAELCRRHLRQFVEVAWPIVEPSRAFIPNWHIDVLCDVLQRVTKGEYKRVIINIPPGSMKSLLVSVLWPAWEWASDPGKRYLCGSYGSHLSIRDNIRVRQLITSSWYKKHFPKTVLDGDQNAKERYNTTSLGWRIATSVGGVGTGEHPDRIIIDDPTSADQARSDAERKAANDWFDRTISSRIARDPAIIVIMQRLHEEDLTGWILDKKSSMEELGNLEWEHVCFLMRYEKERANDAEKPEKERWRPDPRDPRTEVGELFWPELYPAIKVRSLEIALGPYGAAGQLQQRPAPEGGGLFKRNWFEIVEPSAVPPKARRVRGWDTAASEDDGDYTVGVKIAQHGDTYYVEDVTRGQWSSKEVDDIMLQTAKIDGKRCQVREEREGGASGKAVIETRRKKLKGYDYNGVSTTGDKVVRAGPYRSQCEGGNVKIVRGAWNSEYLSELSSFPVGKHDDQVDGSSCAFNALSLEGPKLSKATW